MSGIVLSASVRQNLLSLQSTASLLATTQNDLATGNKVNSALDNPTNFFTAQGLNNRASDINNLLDGIGNGVQVLQAANTGITSLQSLVASAQSIANQVLQSPVGYSTKSNVTSTAITGATATNLLGPGEQQYRDSGTRHSGRDGDDHQAERVDHGHHHLRTASRSTARRSPSPTPAATLSPRTADRSDLTNATVEDLLAAIDTITGATVASTLGAAKLTLSTGTTTPLVIGGNAGTLTALGLTAGTTQLTPSRAQRRDADDRRHRRRHRHQHHLRYRRRPGLDAQRAQYGAGGEQPAGQHRHHRQDQHRDHQRCGFVDDRHDRRHGDDRSLQRDCGCPGRRSELAGDPRQPGRAVQQRPRADQHHRAGLRPSTASTC